MKLEHNILIADSGSTKTSWLFTNGIITKQYTTGGANPFFRNTEDIVKEWREGPVDQLDAKVSHVFFYAAGVVNNEKAGVIKNALQVFFPGAEISVQSDLLAAAHATLGNEKGIACILGTGSNSCLYDGRYITAHVPPLGYILGDEGSGAVLGRKLISDYLKKMMPEELRNLFRQNYPIKYDEILERVYRSGNPNRFLAGFVPFLKTYISHEYCATLVTESFNQFLTRNVAQYENYEAQLVSFTGSIAWYFQEPLRAVLKERNIRIGAILKEPVLNLMKYHLQQYQHE